MLFQYKYIIGVVLFFCLNYVDAQQSTLSTYELNQAIQQSVNDTNKVNLYFKLASSINKYQSAEHIQAYKNALELSEKLNYAKGVKKSYSSLINAFYAKEMFDYALTYCLRFKEYSAMLKDSVALSQANHYMGILLSKQGNYKESLKYHQLSNEGFKSIGDGYAYSRGLVSEAITYFDQKQYDSAITLFNKSIKLFDPVKNVSEIANSLLGISESYLKLKNYNASLVYAKQAYQLYLSIKLDHGLCNSELTLAQVYYEKQKLDSAKVFASSSLSYARKLNLISIQKDAYHLKSKIFNAQNRFDSAYYYSELNKSISDSLAVKQANYMIDNSLFKFNLLKKENEISIQNSLIAERNTQNKFLLIGLILISITLSIAVWAFIQKNKAAKKIALQKKEIEDKQKEIIDSINYAKRIQVSLLPTKQYIQRNVSRLLNPDSKTEK